MKKINLEKMEKVEGGGCGTWEAFSIAMETRGYNPGMTWATAFDIAFSACDVAPYQQ